MKSSFSALTCKMTLTLWSMVLANVLLSTGCNNTCDLRNTFSAARVVITTIGTPHRFLEVTASGFHPNSAAKVKIPFLPTLTGTQNFEAPVTMDAKGALRWTLEPVVRLGLDADPNTDILINVVEDASGCFAASTIKQREFIKIL